jgi:hypothetical protein
VKISENQLNTILHRISSPVAVLGERWSAAMAPHILLSSSCSRHRHQEDTTPLTSPETFPLRPEAKPLTLHQQCDILNSLSRRSASGEYELTLAVELEAIEADFRVTYDELSVSVRGRWSACVVETSMEDDWDQYDVLCRMQGDSLWEKQETRLAMADKLGSGTGD